MKGIMKITAFFLFLTLPLFAQEQTTDSPTRRSRTNESQRTSGTNTPSASYVDEAPAVTQHELQIPSKKLKYKATVAQMPINHSNGDTEAHIFYIAYTLDDVADLSKRPLTFAFNGGPGSASIWVHMGAMGPKRAKLLDN